MGFVMLRRSMSWRNGCPGKWNWGRKIEAEPRGFESHSLLQYLPEQLNTMYQTAP